MQNVQGIGNFLNNLQSASLQLSDFCMESVGLFTGIHGDDNTNLHQCLRHQGFIISSAWNGHSKHRYQNRRDPLAHNAIDTTGITGTKSMSANIWLLATQYVKLNHFIKGMLPWCNTAYCPMITKPIWFCFLSVLSHALHPNECGHGLRCVVFYWSLAMVQFTCIL